MVTRASSKLAQSLSGSSLSAEERAAKAFQAQQDAIAKTKADLGKPVTTYDQAVAFGNSEIGKRIPDMDKWLYNLEWSYYNYGNAKPATRERNFNYYLSLINQAKTNLPKAMEQGLATAAKNYLYAVRSYNIDPHPQYAAILDRRKNELNDAVKLSMEVGVPAQTIVRSLEAGQGEYTDSLNRMAADLSKSDRIWGIADQLIVGGLTGGLGLSATNAAVLGSALAIANGANVQDALRAGIGTVAANQVPEFLNSVGAVSNNDVVNAAVANAGRQATFAAITNQDVKQFALAGLAGGAAAQTLASAQDNVAISRATGEYIQAITGGKSSSDAMQAALMGFADAEKDAARKKIQDQAIAQRAGLTGEQAGLSMEQVGALPEVTVTAPKVTPDVGSTLSLPSPTSVKPTVPQEIRPTLPEVTVTAEKPKEPQEPLVGANLSVSQGGISADKKEAPTQKKELSDQTIFLSLLSPQTIFGMPTPDRTRAATQTAAGPGSQALAQALRIGDVGAPIFGREEEGRRAGWNLRSLRYMGDSEG